MSLKKDIGQLRKELKIKEEIVRLLVEYESAGPGESEERVELRDKIRIKLKEEPWLESYFLKFPFAQSNGIIKYPIISKVPQGHLSSRYLNPIKEDIFSLKNDIINKEHILQQKEYLGEQKSFLAMQKEDVLEGKKDRKRISAFTLILAVGVLASIIFNILQSFIQFKLAQTLHILLFSALSCAALALVLLFVMYILETEETLKQFWKKKKFWIIILSLIILVTGFFLIINQDKQIDSVQDNGINLLNQNIVNLDKTLNQSLKSHKFIEDKLKVIILNQENKTQYG